MPDSTPATAACHCGGTIVPGDGFDLCRHCKFAPCPQCEAPVKCAVDRCTEDMTIHQVMLGKGEGVEALVTIPVCATHYGLRDVIDD